MIQTTRRLAVLALACTAATLSFAQSKSGEIRIAHIYSKTGPLEAYGKQTHTGLMMGLNHATGGTMTVGGKKIVVIEKDDQGKPDLGKSLLASAYSARPLRPARCLQEWSWRCCGYPAWRPPRSASPWSRQRCSTARGCAPRSSWWRRWRRPGSRPAVRALGGRGCFCSRGCSLSVAGGGQSRCFKHAAVCACPELFTTPLPPPCPRCAVLGQEEVNVQRLRVQGMTCSSCAGTGEHDVNRQAW